MPNNAPDPASASAAASAGVAQGLITVPINAPSTAAPPMPECASRRSMFADKCRPHDAGSARHSQTAAPTTTTPTAMDHGPGSVPSRRPRRAASSPSTSNATFIPATKASDSVHARRGVVACPPT